MIVAMSERGRIDRDDRGQAQWKWAAETLAPAYPNDETFDYLEAIGAELELAQMSRGKAIEPVDPAEATLAYSNGNKPLHWRLSSGSPAARRFAQSIRMRGYRVRNALPEQLPTATTRRYTRPHTDPSPKRTSPVARTDAI